MSNKQIKCFKFNFKIKTKNNINTNINYDKFFDYIIKQNNELLVFGKYRKLVIRELNNNFICGILLSYKDYKSFCKYENNILTTQIIDKSVDYNFFIIDKMKLSGIWTQYFESATISVFKEIINMYLLNFANNKKIYIPEIFLVQNGDNMKFLERYIRVLKISFYEENQTDNFVLKDYTKIEKREFRFIKDNNFSSLIQKIKEFFGDKKELKITAINLNNKQETFGFDELFIPIQEYEYDEITQRYFNKLIPDNINDCIFIKNDLLTLHKNNEE